MMCGFTAMKIVRFIHLILFSLSLVTFTQAQTIPSNRQVDWSNAGVQSWYLDTTNVANVKNFGATGDGITNDYVSIINAINSLGGHSGIVFFPAGNYRINAGFSLPDSVTFKGEGAGLTTLIFNLGVSGGNCINVARGQSNSFVHVDSGYAKDSRLLYIANASGFNNGDYAELVENNGAWNVVPISWADNSVGQVVKIDSVSGNMLYLNHALRINYSSSLNVRIQKVLPRVNVGLECLEITRIDSTAPSVNYMVYFNYAANCRMIGVESDHSLGAHVWAEQSTSLDIHGCYFHHAYKYDGAGTNGYGVGMAVHTGECRIENNIFKHLRHSMIVKQGANGNVFGYNYSTDPNRSEPIADFGADICLHGHYAFANLFEGNICQNLMIDSTWGPSGPFNTFFRNRVELYGIMMTPGASVPSDSETFVGNDVTNSVLFHGNYILAGTGHFTYGNNILGTINPPGTSALPDSTYYLSSRPSFWNIAASWPDIGTPYPVAGETNPAYERFKLNNFTVCEGDLSTGLAPGRDKEEVTKIVLFPALFSNEVTLYFNTYIDHLYIINIFDLSGQLVMQQQVFPGHASTRFVLDTSGLQSGFYLISVDGAPGRRQTFKCVKVN